MANARLRGGFGRNTIAPITDRTAVAAMLAKLDSAVRLLQEDARTSSRPGAEMALAALESLRDDLTGKKPN